MQRDPDAPDQAHLDHDLGAAVPPERYLYDTTEQRHRLAAALQETSPPHDALLLPHVHQLIQPYLERARQHGPIPPLRSDQWLDAHPDQQVAHLLIVGMGTVLANPHAVIRHVLKQASTDVHQAGVDQHGPAHWQRAGMQHRRNIDEVDRRRDERLPARCDSCHGHLHDGTDHECRRTA